MKAQDKRTTDEQAVTISGVTHQSNLLLKSRHRGRGSGFLTVLPGIIVFCVVLLVIF